MPHVPTSVRVFIENGIAITLLVIQQLMMTTRLDNYYSDDATLPNTAKTVFKLLSEGDTRRYAYEIYVGNEL